MMKGCVKLDLHYCFLVLLKYKDNLVSRGEELEKTLK